MGNVVECFMQIYVSEREYANHSARMRIYFREGQFSLHPPGVSLIQLNTYSLLHITT